MEIKEPLTESEYHQLTGGRLSKQERKELFLQRHDPKHTWGENARITFMKNHINEYWAIVRW